MKKIFTLALATVLALSALTGCSSQQEDGNVSTDGSSQQEGGNVSTDGSTSMEEVIGVLGEAFQEKYSGMTFTYNPTGSGSGIQAARRKKTRDEEVLRERVCTHVKKSVQFTVDIRRGTDEGRQLAQCRKAG